MATVLIVDDEPAVRKYLAEVLGESGIRPVEAASGAEALREARNQHPDVVIADVLMPQMDGFELVRRLRDQPDLARTPIILMTGVYLEDEVRPLAQACGVASLITKPATKADLLRAVGQALQRPSPPELPPATEAFSQRHLQLLSNKVAATIKELESANRRLARLVDLGRQLSLERDPLELMNAYCQESRAILGASYAAIGVLREDGEWASFLFSGLEEEARRTLLPPPRQGLVGQVLEMRRPVRIPEVRDELGGAIFAPPHPQQGPFLGVAIASSRELYGILYFMGKVELEAFTEEDEDTAVALSAQVGVAYRSARQFKQIRDQVTRLEQEATAREQVQAALRKSEQYVRSVIEAAGNMMVSLSPDHRILEWNREAECLHGWSRHEVLGQNYLELFLPKPDREAFADRIRQVLAGQPPLAGDQLIRLGDGAERLVQFTINRILDENGQSNCVIVVGHDITERRGLEEELKRQREQMHMRLGELEQIYRYAPVGLCFVDRELRYVRINEQLAAMNGIPVADHIGRTLREIIPGVAGVEEAYHRALATGEAVLNVEIHGVTAAEPGVERDWLCSYWPMKSQDGTYAGVAVAVIEITQRKRAENELAEYAERLQTLSARLLEVQESERRHLARELHDEIGQELTGLQFVLETGWDLSVEEVRAKLQEARGTVSGLLAKVRELSFDLRPAMLDHLGLLPALLWLFERYMAQTKVRVHFRHEGVSGRFAPTTETVAYRIIQEALTNVARHARVSEVTVRVWVQEGVLNLQVEDEGGGFDPETALGSEASTGLAGIQERVQLMGGQLNIDTAPGAGTHLMARLPLAP